MRQRWSIPSLLLALLLPTGCNRQLAQRLGGEQFVDPSPSLNPPASRPASVPPLPGAPPREVREPSRVAKAQDPATAGQNVVNISIYQLSVPLGAVSRSDAFWKRVDENVLDISTHELLWKNGLRAGVAQLADFDQFMQVLDRDPVQAKPLILVAPNVKVAELPVKQAVPEQTISYFNAANELAIRSYDDCDNNFVLECQRQPRKPGSIRVGLCPMVRSLRRKLVAVGDVDTREIEIRQPERLFDLNLRVELSAEQFLIVAPSPEARARMSVGHCFLVHDGDTQRREDVLLIIPQVVTIRKKAPPGEPAARPAPNLPQQK